MPEAGRSRGLVLPLVAGLLGALGHHGAARPAAPSETVRWERGGAVVLELRWHPARSTGDAPSTASLYGREFADWSPGQRLGTMRLFEPWVDRRGQEIPPGDYVLRYAVQPFSKNHVETTARRDFLLLVPAAEDPAAGVLDEEALWAAGRRASGTSHPAVMEIRAPAAPGSRGLPGETLLRTTIGTREVLLVLAVPTPPPPAAPRPPGGGAERSP